MLPEVRVLIERAAARRFALEGLLDAIPADYWARSAPGDAWPVRGHVEHLATIEEMVAETVRAINSGDREAWAGGASTVQALGERRGSLMAAVGASSNGQLRERMASSRNDLAWSLAALEPAHLDAGVLVAGIVDTWRQPVRFTLRQYLSSWPEHDVEHDASIRRALATTPDLSTAALVRRAQRER
jgi:DinB superfamily